MIRFIGNLVLSTALTILVLWIGYEIAKRRMGVESTQSVVFLTMYRLLAVIVGMTIFQLLFDIYGFSIFWLLAISLSIVWVMSWPFRRWNAGATLQAGNVHPPKSFFWHTLFLLAIIGPQIWSLIWLTFKTVPKGYVEIWPGTFFYIMLAFLLLLSILESFSSLTFRERGICYRYTFIPWGKVKAYRLNTPSSGVLTLQFRQKLPIYPGIVRIPIPLQQMESVQNILNEKLAPQKLTSVAKNESSMS